MPTNDLWRDRPDDFHRMGIIRCRVRAMVGVRVHNDDDIVVDARSCVPPRVRWTILLFGACLHAFRMRKRKSFRGKITQVQHFVRSQHVRYGCTFCGACESVKLMNALFILVQMHTNVSAMTTTRCTSGSAPTTFPQSMEFPEIFSSHFNDLRTRLLNSIFECVRFFAPALAQYAHRLCGSALAQCVCSG